MTPTVLSARAAATALVSLLAPPFLPGWRACAATGAVIGVTETATGIGGPPLALVFQHASGSVLRTTVVLRFLLGRPCRSPPWPSSAGSRRHSAWARCCSRCPWRGAYLSRLADGALDARCSALRFCRASGRYGEIRGPSSLRPVRDRSRSRIAPEDRGVR